MKLVARIIAPPLLLLACALACHAQQPAATALPPALQLGEWREFAPAGGGFSILFPGTPEPATLTEPVGDGRTAQVHVYLLNHPTLECSVSYADYPVRGDERALVAAFLDRAGKSAPAGGGQVLSFTEIEHEGHPARMLRRRKPDGKILRAKIVLVGLRQYQFGCVTPREDGVPAETVRQYEAAVTKFIDSFKLAAAPTATAPPAPEAAPLLVAVAPPGEVDQYLADHPGEVYFMLREGEIGRLADDGAPISMSRVAEGKPISKPTPAYPAIARAARASGAVVVMVVVDEEGKVVAAQAHDGHPLLRASAVKAAREARFTPTLVDGKPVKVSGTITYNFDLR